MKKKGIGNIRMVNLTCNHCGANLDLDIDNLQAYCPFCGNRLMIDAGQMHDILTEKEKTKQKRLKYERDVEIIKTREEHRESGKAKAGLIGVLIFVILFAFIFLMMKMNAG